MRAPGVSVRAPLVPSFISLHSRPSPPPHALAALTPLASSARPRLLQVVRTIFFGVKRTEQSLSQLQSLDPYPVQRPSSIWSGIESGRLPESLSRSRRGSMPDLTDVSGGVTTEKLAKNLGTGSLLDQYDSCTCSRPGL